MPAKLLSGSIQAPGFNGINTQDSSVSLDSGWATTASNCVIDKFGRIGARRGWQMVTTNPGTLTVGTTIDSIFEFKDIDGSFEYLCAGDNKIFHSADASVLEAKTIRNATNTGDIVYTITGNNWQWCSLPTGQGAGATGSAYVAQLSHPLLTYRHVSGSHIFQRVGDIGSVPTGYTVSTFDPNVIISGYGRVWTACTTDNKTTVFYSVLLDGADFTGAGSGVLDVSAVIGNNDEITALAVHNNFLIVFCKNNTVVYANANDVDNITLSDVIKGVGCIARDSVQSSGTDIIFLSKTGIRSLLRTVQEKTLPLRELSINIRDDLVAWINGEDLPSVKSAYYERDAFYLLTLPTLKQVICFDMRQSLPNGAAKITVWEDIEHKAFCSTENRDLFVGQVNGVGKYYGFTDNGTAYHVRYYTSYFDMQAPATLKMLKKIGVVLVGGQGQNFVIKYGFDYSTTFQSRTLTSASSGTTAEYNIAEYNIGEYSGGALIQDASVNVGGSGKVLQLGFEADVNGNSLSIQKIDVALVSGKTII